MKKSILLLFFAFVFQSIAFAGNVLGGEISHKAIGPNQYEITLKRYRDCTDQGSPSTSRIVDWTADGSFSGSITVNQTSSEEIDIYCPTQSSICNGGGGAYGVILYTFTGILTVPSNYQDIVVSYRATYRPGGLANIYSNGSNRGEYIYTEIDNTLSPYDNSIQFVEPPKFLITQNIGTPQIIKNEVLDVDGDSVYFSFVTPARTSTNLVAYKPGFSFTEPLGVGVTSINSETGDITITDPSVMIATIAILVEQYRNGVKISETVRDWSIRVVPGSNALPIISTIDSGGSDTIVSCTYNLTCFDVIITDINPGDVLAMSHNNLDTDFTVSASGPGVPSSNSVTVTICGTKTTPGTHTIELTAYDDACPVMGKVTKTFTIIINGGNTSTDTRTECAPFTWIDGNTYTADNSSALHNIGPTSNAQCDSIRFLDLTIINPTTGTDTRTECDSLIWIDGNTYYADNTIATFNIIGGAANTCDSLVTLDLTIINSVTGTDTRTECNSYDWIDGNTYTSSNNTATFNIVGGAANTCDSLVTLDLTIVNTMTGTDTRTACDSLIWIDGNTYYTSNNTATFNIIGGAVNTCDSLVTIDLTIITIDPSVTQSGALLTANESGLSYQWINCPELTPIIGATNQSFTADSNGDYAVVITNNLCSDTSDCFTVSGVGIIENEFGNNLLLFPNPTNGNFSVDLGAMYDATTITLTDLTGKTIQSQIFYNSQILKMSIEEPSGTYLLVIESDNKKAVIRLIKA